MRVTRVDFAFDAHMRLAQAISSTLRHVARGSRLFVYCNNPQIMAQFDEALWSADEIAFVAHEKLSQTDIEHLQVLMVDQTNWSLLHEVVRDDDWLLNLDDNCPPEVTLFTRVLEIVSTEPLDKDCARLRWKHYQSAGLDLQAHRLTNNQSTFNETTP
jgi:DNA polymerase III subunit chi